MQEEIKQEMKSAINKFQIFHDGALEAMPLQVISSDPELARMHQNIISRQKNLFASKEQELKEWNEKKFQDKEFLNSIKNRVLIRAFRKRWIDFFSAIKRKGILLKEQRALLLKKINSAEWDEFLRRSNQLLIERVLAAEAEKRQLSISRKDIKSIAKQIESLLETKAELRISLFSVSKLRKEIRTEINERQVSLRNKKAELEALRLSGIGQENDQYSDLAFSVEHNEQMIPLLETAERELKKTELELQEGIKKINSRIQNLRENLDASKDLEEAVRKKASSAEHEAQIKRINTFRKKLNSTRREIKQLERNLQKATSTSGPRSQGDVEKIDQIRQKLKNNCTMFENVLAEYNQSDLSQESRNMAKTGAAERYTKIQNKLVSLKNEYIPKRISDAKKCIARNDTELSKMQQEIIETPGSQQDPVAMQIFSGLKTTQSGVKVALLSDLESPEMAEPGKLYLGINKEGLISYVVRDRFNVLDQAGQLKKGTINNSELKRSISDAIQDPNQISQFEGIRVEVCDCLRRRRLYHLDGIEGCKQSLAREIEHEFDGPEGARAKLDEMLAELNTSSSKSLAEEEHKNWERQIKSFEDPLFVEISRIVQPNESYKCKAHDAKHHSPTLRASIEPPPAESKPSEPKPTQSPPSKNPSL